MYLTLSDYIVLGILAAGIVVATIMTFGVNKSETEPEKKEEIPEEITFVKTERARQPFLLPTVFLPSSRWTRSSTSKMDLSLQSALTASYTTAVRNTEPW